jgi:hypothetical protein
MTQWGELFDSFVDAALTTDVTVGRDDILTHLKSGTLVPSRYLYSSDSGAANWIQLCEDSTYPLHKETVQFWTEQQGKEVAELIHERLGRDDADYVSLGPGDGEKDAGLINHWLDAGMDIFYYPYDISRMLVSKAVYTVRENVPQAAKDRLRIKAVLADFYQLHAVRTVFAHRDSPNVVGLFGGLGNLTNERQFLLKLKQEMRKGDILVLEVRLKSEEEDHVSELKEGVAALRFDFGALESYLGLSFDPAMMTVERQAKKSSIADAVTTIVGCKDVHYDGKVFEEAKLLVIHQYSEGAFLGALKRWGFDVLKTWRGDGTERFLICVARLGDN